VRSVLDGIYEIKNLRFEELKSKLELRFGEGHLAQTYYTQFTNRNFWKIWLHWARIKRDYLVWHIRNVLTRSDKIANAQFIVALSDGLR